MQNLVILLQKSLVYIFYLPMLHYINWKRIAQGSISLIKNEYFWIQAFYAGNSTEWEFFIYPHLDDNKKTISYFAFDSIQQKSFFEELLKINGIGTKTAFLISQYDQKSLNEAIKHMDSKFFQTIPGIGPKSAKKILLEMKGTLDLDQISALDIDQKLFKDIVKSLKGFGYDSGRIKEVLSSYEGKLSKDKIPEIVKWVISHI